MPTSRLEDPEKEKNAVKKDARLLLLRKEVIKNARLTSQLFDKLRLLRRRLRDGIKHASFSISITVFPFPLNLVPNQPIPSINQLLVLLLSPVLLTLSTSLPSGSWNQFRPSI